MTKETTPGPELSCDFKLAEFPYADIHPSKPDLKQLVPELRGIQVHLGLESQADALHVAIRLSGVIARELGRGGRILVEHKSGAKSELIVQARGAE